MFSISSLHLHAAFLPHLSIQSPFFSFPFSSFLLSHLSSFPSSFPYPHLPLPFSPYSSFLSPLLFSLLTPRILTYLTPPLRSISTPHHSLPLSPLAPCIPAPTHPLSYLCFMPSIHFLFPPLFFIIISFPILISQPLFPSLSSIANPFPFTIDHHLSLFPSHYSHLLSSHLSLTSISMFSHHPPPHYPQTPYPFPSPFLTHYLFSPSSLTTSSLPPFTPPLSHVRYLDITV